MYVNNMYALKRIHHTPTYASSRSLLPCPNSHLIFTNMTQKPQTRPVCQTRAACQASLDCQTSPVCQTNQTSPVPPPAVSNMMLLRPISRVDRTVHLFCSPGHITNVAPYHLITVARKKLKKSLQAYHTSITRTLGARVRRRKYSEVCLAAASPTVDTFRVSGIVSSQSIHCHTPHTRRRDTHVRAAIGNAAPSFKQHRDRR